MADAREHGGIGVGADDELEELHVADGVEEVHHQEALLERLGSPFHHLGDAEARGVRGDHRVRPDHLLDALEDGVDGGRIEASVAARPGVCTCLQGQRVEGLGGCGVVRLEQRY